MANFDGRPTPQSPVSNDTLAMMQYHNSSKSAGVTYLLWFFLGILGGHRYYLGDIGIGALMTVCFLLGLFLMVPLIIPALICLYDLFTIPAQVRKYNTGVMARLVAGRAA